MKARFGAIQSKDATSRNECAVPWWQGDQICDDENNNAECNWDGGDCCNNVFPLWNIWCTVSTKIKNSKYVSILDKILSSKTF